MLFQILLEILNSMKHMQILSIWVVIVLKVYLNKVESLSPILFIGLNYYPVAFVGVRGSNA